MELAAGMMTNTLPPIKSSFCLATLPVSIAIKMTKWLLTMEYRSRIATNKPILIFLRRFYGNTSRPDSEHRRQRIILAIQYWHRHPLSSRLRWFVLCSDVQDVHY